MRIYSIDDSALLDIDAESSGDKPAPGAQGSGQWHNDRKGKLTASRMAAAMKWLKNGKSSAERTNLLHEIVVERLTDELPDHYVSPAMEWGILHEPRAKAAYAKLTGNAVKNTGFWDHPEIDLFGASPDGLIDDDGLAEFKCPTSRTHLEYLIAGIVPEEYRPQMIVQLECTGRLWCDFVSFDPRMPEHRRLFLLRYVPTPEEVALVRAEAILFLDEVETLFDSLSLQPFPKGRNHV